MAPTRCPTCQEDAGRRKLVSCAACEERYHLACAGLARARADWTCEACAAAVAESGASESEFGAETSAVSQGSQDDDSEALGSEDSDSEDGEDEEEDEEEDDTACRVCDVDDDDANLLLCDGCDGAFHTYCVGLADVPPEDEDWYCVDCEADRRGVDFSALTSKIRERSASLSEEAPAKKARAGLPASPAKAPVPPSAPTPAAVRAPTPPPAALSADEYQQSHLVEAAPVAPSSPVRAASQRVMQSPPRPQAQAFRSPGRSSVLSFAPTHRSPSKLEAGRSPPRPRHPTPQRTAFDLLNATEDAVEASAKAKAAKAAKFVRVVSPLKQRLQEPALLTESQMEAVARGPDALFGSE